MLTAPDEDGELTVRFGIMKMTVQLADDNLDGQKAEPVVKPKPAPAIVAPPPPPVPAIRTSQNTLDLRGKRVADAEYMLDKAISEAAGPVWIIHGHGTGKLRLGVHAYLQQHPRAGNQLPNRTEPSPMAAAASPSPMFNKVEINVTSTARQNSKFKI